MSIREGFKQAAQAAAGKVEKVAGLPAGFPEVWVRPLTAAEWDEYEAACVQAGKAAGKGAVNGSRHLLVRLAACDADRKPAFGPADDDFLKGLDITVVGPIAKQALDLMGMGGADVGNP